MQGKYKYTWNWGATNRDSFKRFRALLMEEKRKDFFRLCARFLQKGKGMGSYAMPQKIFLCSVQKPKKTSENRNGSIQSLCEGNAPQFQNPERTKETVDQSICRKYIYCSKNQSDPSLTINYCSGYCFKNPMRDKINKEALFTELLRKRGKLKDVWKAMTDWWFAVQEILSKLSLRKW